MKKILIIAYYFHPQNFIGAVRPTKLAKYLSLTGYTVDIITGEVKERKQNDKSFGTADIIQIPHSRMHKKIMKFIDNRRGRRVPEFTIGEKGKTQGSFKNKLKKYISILLNTYFTTYDFFKEFKRYYRQNINSFKRYDIVITTYNPISTVLCGYYVKKRMRQIKWICDFRDPMTSVILPNFFNLINKKIQNKATFLSDNIVTVSKGYLKRIVGNQYKDKSYVITNGFDNDDIKNLTTDGYNNSFSFTYTGHLYGGKRNLSPLFRAFRELIDNRIIDKTDIVVNYAGDEYHILWNQAREFELEDIILNKGLLPRDLCLNLQLESRFLILSTWNYSGEEGVFPGKFLEYMLMNKPIISIVDGNLPNSEVTSVMDDANIGVSYEAPRHGKDYIILKEYINKEYTRFKEGLEPDFYPNLEVVKKFNYEEIAKQFEELF